MKIIQWKRAVSVLVVVAAVRLPLTAQSPLIGSKPVLTLDAARGIVAAAEKAAQANHWAMAIAILDDGGNLLLLERMDSAHLACIEIAQQKARTAAIFNAPSKAMADGLTAGTTALLKLDVLPFEGGIPIMFQGKQIGSIGVSGGDIASYDGKVAQAGVDWFTANAGK